MLQSVGPFPLAFCGVSAYAGSIGGKGQADETLRQTNNHDAARLRRSLTRDLHSRDTHRVMAGLIGLRALCGHASDKYRDSLPAFGGNQSPAGRRQSGPRDVLRAFGARPLSCSEAPGLYAILSNISRRAGLERAPELFLLPCHGMNAYALGGPEDACISVTRELLRCLSREEIAGIIAHEVAHILHRDTGAMHWASAVQREIAALAQRGIRDLMARSQDFVRIGSQALLLAAAPVMAELLIAALSRVRELAADARAMDLIEHPKALVAALCKLEYFHTGLSPLHAHLRQDTHALRSHPGTWERISHLS
ncbi:MAG: M48 family metalloprotease [Rhodoblastus sp.]|uniref:M48 family metalloprotease n=1 Tax=Rhodoblastus sp. TaxID=1962975 RepID=UPI003F988EEF